MTLQLGNFGDAASSSRPQLNIVWVGSASNADTASPLAADSSSGDLAAPAFDTALAAVADISTAGADLSRSLPDTQVPPPPDSAADPVQLPLRTDEDEDDGRGLGHGRFGVWNGLPPGLVRAFARMSEHALAQVGEMLLSRFGNALDEDQGSAPAAVSSPPDAPPSASAPPHQTPPPVDTSAAPGGPTTTTQTAPVPAGTNLTSITQTTSLLGYSGTDALRTALQSQEAVTGGSTAQIQVDNAGQPVSALGSTFQYANTTARMDASGNLILSQSYAATSGGGVNETVSITTMYDQNGQVLSRQARVYSALAGNQGVTVTLTQSYSGGQPTSLTLQANFLNFATANSMTQQTTQGSAIQDAASLLQQQGVSSDTVSAVSNLLRQAIGVTGVRV